MSRTAKTFAPSEPLKIGDHPALDFLNTVVLNHGVLVDRLQTDEDVLHWLGAMGYERPKRIATVTGSLLKTTCALREEFRYAIETLKAGRRVNWQSLNELFAMSHSYAVIGMHDGRPQLKHVWGQETAEQILGPLLEAVGELLISDEFDLIRRCENQECVLWFCDKTKSHRRRWCNMSTCGNRSKVNAFRERQKDLRAPSPLR